MTDPARGSGRIAALLLAFVLAWLPFGVLAADGSGIGGTGDPVRHDEGSGIGGTGAPRLAHEGSGIGGTGIVGIITGFGSIWVNGVEVHYPADAVIRTPNGPRGPEALALGQRVLISAAQQDGRTAGTDITLLPTVTGPVTAHSGDRLTVAGQQVMSITRGTQPGPRIGDWLAVYGMRRNDGLIVATAMTPQPADTRVNVYGEIQAGADGGLRIQGLPLAITGQAAPAPGSTMQVSGTLRDGVLVATQIRPDPVATLATGQHAISIQGYVRDSGAGRITVDNLAIQLAAPAASEPQVDALVQIEAHHDDDGTLVADQITALDLHDHGLPAPQIDPQVGDADEHARDERHRDEDETPEQVREHADIEHADAEQPEIESPEVESPEVESPEVETPEAETPEVETPEVETPEVETPEVETPEVEAPEVEIPEIESPEVEVPEVEPPETEIT